MWEDVFINNTSSYVNTVNLQLQLQIVDKSIFRGKMIFLGDSGGNHFCCSIWGSKPILQKLSSN